MPKSKADRVLSLAIAPQRALEIFANEYPSVPKAILEGIQNALDANARRIEVKIDLLSGKITIDDDGEGCGIEEMTEKIGKIGKSMKNGSKSLGHFGVGLVAFFNKCDRLSLTSRKLGSSQSEQHCYDLSNLVDLGEDKFGFGCMDLKRDVSQWWNTRLCADKIHKNYSLMRVYASLPDSILSSYELKMLETGAKITIFVEGAKAKVHPITVQAREGFEGSRLDIPNFSIPGLPISGFELKFELYLSKEGNGRIYFRPDENAVNRYPLSGILAAAVEAEVVKGDLVKALNSGFLEGYIYCSHVEMQVNRTAAVDNMGSALFFSVLDAWFRKVGSKYIDSAKIEERERTQNRILEEAIKRLNGNPEALSAYWRVINLPKNQVPGRNETSPKGWPTGHPSDQARTPREVGADHRERKPQPKVTTPNGKPPTTLDDAISIMYGEMEGSLLRSEFIPNERKLVINRRHKDFRLREADLEKLGEYVYLLLCVSLASPVLGGGSHEGFQDFLGLLITLNVPIAQVPKG